LRNKNWNLHINSLSNLIEKWKLQIWYRFLMPGFEPVAFNVSAADCPDSLHRLTSGGLQLSAMEKENLAMMLRGVVIDPGSRPRLAPGPRPTGQWFWARHAGMTFLLKYLVNAQAQFF
jgi:hypothetical protein